jgi:hypothetical protein
MDGDREGSNSSVRIIDLVYRRIKQVDTINQSHKVSVPLKAKLMAKASAAKGVENWLVVAGPV